eukprot:scaffold2495_cov101-Isochrysis_galbana.AAC.9
MSRRGGAGPSGFSSVDPAARRACPDLVCQEMGLVLSRSLPHKPCSGFKGAALGETGRHNRQHDGASWASEARLATRASGKSYSKSTAPMHPRSQGASLGGYSAQSASSLRLFIERIHPPAPARGVHAIGSYSKSSAPCLGRRRQRRCRA